MPRSKIILVSTLLLAACQTTPPPGIKTVIQKVEIPVATPCKEAIPVTPVFNFDKLVPSNDIYGQVLISMLPLYTDHRFIFSERKDSVRWIESLQN